MLFVELEREYQITRQYEEEYGRLQLEQSTWAIPTRIDLLARERLGMQLPDPNRIWAVNYHEKAQAATEEAR
jgi:cell division protein FtsL